MAILTQRELDNLFDLRVQRALHGIREAQSALEATEAYESAYDIASDEDRVTMRAALIVAHARCVS